MRKFSFVFILLIGGAGRLMASPLVPVIEIEEEIYSYRPANNGSDPMWDYGSSNIVRVGEQVSVSGLETLENVAPYNNTQCTFWQRGRTGWLVVQSDQTGRTREPCPLAVHPAQNLIYLSANPTLNPLGRGGGGPAKPVIQIFAANDREQRPPVVVMPVWSEKAAQSSFNEHSYRSFAADGTKNQLVLFQNVNYSHAEWAFRDGSGRWSAQGQLQWPWGSEYAQPKPIRLCYSNVSVSENSVHFVGVSDIIEPNEPWRLYRRQFSGKDGDFQFRRLFYTRNSDINAKQFDPWLEISNREKTAGLIKPGDLWLAPDGAAHIVWEEIAIDTRLRKAFFPDAKQRNELNYAIVRNGVVVKRTTLVAKNEDEPGPFPHLPRFHMTPDKRLFVFFYVDGTDERGKAIMENRLVEVNGDGALGPIVSLPLIQPLSRYMTATVRTGSAPSFLLDLLGTAAGTPRTVRYARIRLN